MTGCPRPGAADHPGERIQRPPRHRRRRRRRRLLGVLVLLFVAGGVLGGRALLLNSPRFRVAQVQVTAPEGLDVGTVRAATGVRLGSPLVSVDPDAVSQAVATLPAVASVQVSRNWPRTVQVTVTERTPVAVTASAHGPWLVDATGVAYRPAPHPAPELPSLTAVRVAPNDPATRAALAVLVALPETVRTQLRVVSAQGPNAVMLRLVDGKQVSWGSPEDSARKAQVLAALLTQRGSFYDVSAPDLPTLRR